MVSTRVQKIIAQMGKAVGLNSGLGGTVKFDFGEDGSAYIDGKSAPNTVSDGEGKAADCTVSMALKTYDGIINGELDRTSAFMEGKLRVAGEMALVIRILPMLAKARD